MQPPVASAHHRAPRRRPCLAMPAMSTPVDPAFLQYDVS
jgi:hypothetical protein